jgi:hypothetical protein
MSRAMHGLVFLSSLAIGSAATTLRAEPVRPPAMPPCPCTTCAFTSGGIVCNFNRGTQCGFAGPDNCYVQDCQVNQKCFGE